jgi:hypothetical protein
MVIQASNLLGRKAIRRQLVRNSSWLRQFMEAVESRFGQKIQHLSPDRYNFNYYTNLAMTSGPVKQIFNSDF